MQQQSHFDINPQLLKNTLMITGLKDEAEVIDLALNKRLNHEKQKKILELEGRINWEGNLEHLRTGRKFNGSH